MLYVTRRWDPVGVALSPNGRRGSSVDAIGLTSCDTTLFFGERCELMFQGN